MSKNAPITNNDSNISNNNSSVNNRGNNVNDNKTFGKAGKDGTFKECGKHNGNLLISKNFLGIIGGIVLFTSILTIILKYLVK